MLKISYLDFIEEIKAELYSYEEISEDKIFEWENKFSEMFKKNSFKTIKIKPNDKNLILKDEKDVFQIADGFWSALINNEENEYWNSL